ncbi:MAG: hypothetical protein ABIC82_03465 [bacterium]
MGYEDLTPPNEQPKVESGKLEIEGENRLNYLAKERKNHADITPAFRILGEIEKKLPDGFEFSRIDGAKFNLPVINLDDISYEMHIQGNNIFVFGYMESYGKNFKVFEATFSKDDNLQEKVNNEQIDYKEIISEGEEMRKVLPQEGDLVMIDKICHLDENKVVATRKVNDLDFEGDGQFNKFRLIEMVGQAGSYYLLSKINAGEKRKKIAAYKNMSVRFYVEADDVEKNDELVIEIIQKNEDKKDNKAHGEVQKKDGTIIFECDFCYDKLRRVELFRGFARKAQEIKV